MTRMTLEAISHSHEMACFRISGKEQWVFGKVRALSVCWELLAKVWRRWWDQTQSRNKIRPWHCIGGYRGHPRIVQKEEQSVVEALVCFYPIHVHSLLQYEHHKCKALLGIPRVKPSFDLKFSSVRCKFLLAVAWARQRKRKHHFPFTETGSVFFRAPGNGPNSIAHDADGTWR